MTDFNRVDSTLTGIFEESWRVFWKDLGVYVVAAILASLVTFFSFGLLGGVMAVGYAELVGRLRRGESAGVTNVFDGFNRGLQATILSVIVVLGVTLGLVALIVPGVFLAAAWLLSFTAMGEDDLTAGQALSRSYEIFKQNMAIVSVILVLLVIASSLLGSVFLTIPFLLPFTAVCLHVTYSTLSSPEDAGAGRWEAKNEKARSQSRSRRPEPAATRRGAEEKRRAADAGHAGDKSGRFVPRRIERGGKF